MLQGELRPVMSLKNGEGKLAIVCENIGENVASSITMLPRKIVFVAGTLGKGGAERQLWYQATLLTSLGVEVVVIALKEKEFWAERLNRAGVEVLHAGDEWGRVGKMLRVGRMVKRLRPDVVQSVHFYTNLYVWNAGRTIKSPSIGAVRSDCHSEVAAHGWLLGRMCLLAPDWIAANSWEAVATCGKYGRLQDKVVYVTNVVDTEVFHPRDDLELSDEINLIWCGRMIPSKRPEWFIQLMSELRCEGFPVRGWMIGDGPLVSRVRILARSTAACEDSVEVVGGVDDITSWYRCADILVLTSEHEGTPNVVLEAMSSGLAVATTPVGGVKDLLGQYGDACVAPSDERRFLRKIVCRFLQNPSELIAIKRGLRDRAVRRYGREALRGDLERLYSAVLASA